MTEKSREQLAAELLRMALSTEGLHGSERETCQLAANALRNSGMICGEATRKVFVVIGGYSYEGYCEPEGVYTTAEAAEAAMRHAKRNHYDKLEAMEYELDNGQLEHERATSERKETT